MASAAAAANAITTNGEKRFTPTVYDEPWHDPYMATAVDHVIVCVPDLGASVTGVEQRYGATSVPGGRHRGHGTANRLIPLGEDYIELVAVVDPEEAAGSAFGHWVSDRVSEPEADGLALRTDDLDAVCRRLDLNQLSMSRMTEAGDELRWRIAGMEQLVTSGLPFFIQWEIEPGLHPGRIPTRHPTGDLTLTDVVVTGEISRLERWMGHVDGVRLEPGAPSVRFDVADARERL